MGHQQQQNPLSATVFGQATSQTAVLEPNINSQVLLILHIVSLESAYMLLLNLLRFMQFDHVLG